MRDIRYGLRSFRRYPVATVVAVISLAMGIGATTAVFGLIDAVVLKPLPVSKSNRLVMPTLILPQGAFDNFAYAQFEQFRNAPSLSSLCAWSPDRFDTQWTGQSESVPGQYVSPEYFETLEIAPAIGTFPVASEPAQASSVVISYSFWESRFNGSRAVLGQRVDIGSVPFTIAAVVPKGFFGTEVGSLPDLFVPLAAQPLISHSPPRVRTDVQWLKLVGRLTSNASMQQAGTQLNTILQRQLMGIVNAAPVNTPEQMKREFLQQRIQMVPAGAFSQVRRLFTEPLMILMGLVGLLLLVACANIANLLLCRAVTRRKEMSIRLASGASYGRLIRQLLVESLLLSALGGIAGTILAQWLRWLLVSMFNAGHATVSLDSSLDARFLGFTAAIVVLTGLLFGLAPALRAAKTDLASGLKDGSGMGGGNAGFSFGRVLVGLQVAMSMCLLVGGGLFVRTFMNLRNEDVGFDRRQIVLVRIHPERAGMPRDRLAPFYSQLLDVVRGIPGVQSASLSRFTPIESSALSDQIKVEGYLPQPGESTRVSTNFAYPQFFQTLGTPILMGRDFNSGDRTLSAVIVNQSLVRRYFAGRNPIGQHLQLARPNGAVYEIVGVAPDMKYRNLREPVPMTVFYSALENPSSLSAPQLTVRVGGGMKTSIEAIRRAISGLGVPVGEATTLDEQIDASLVQERVMANLSGALGLVALALTCIGLYGVISYATVQRTREIGIRIALGAEAGTVVWSIVRQTLTTVAAGMLVGLPAALEAIRLVKHSLFGVTPADPLIFASSVALMITVAAVAGYIPARQASRVDPLIALRCE